MAFESSAVSEVRAAVAARLADVPLAKRSQPGVTLALLVLVLLVLTLLLVLALESRKASVAHRSFSADKQNLLAQRQNLLGYSAS